LGVTAVFLMFVISRYMQWGARREIFATIRIEFVFGLILTCACAFLLPSARLNLGSTKGAKHVVSWIFLLFMTMIIQLPFAADKVMAEHIFVDRVIKFAMLTLFMVILIRSPKTMRWFIVAFLFACFYVTQESTQGAISGSLVWQNQGIPRLHGAVPIYRHPNSLAGIAMGVVPFVVFLFPVIQRRWLKLVLLAPLSTSVVCLLYSGSRTGYVAFLSFMIYWWSQSRNKVRWIAVAAGVSLAVVPLLPPDYIERFESIGGKEASGSSKEKRIEILRDAMTIFSENPLGVGVASFPAVRQERFNRSQDTHNLYLEVATNLGVQGLIVFVGLIITMLKVLVETRRLLARQTEALNKVPWVKREPRVRQLVEEHLSDLVFLEASCTAMGGFLFARLILGLFGMDLYEPYWWFAAGGTISLSLLSRSMTRRTTELGKICSF